jgi:hypothetical protein
MNTGLLPGISDRASLDNVAVFIPRPGRYVPTGGTYGWDEFCYEIPPWAKALFIRAIGSGGGGGSGSVEPASTAAWGGGGGGGASVGELWVPTILLPSRLWIFAPWGGAGGAAVATTGTSGNNGGPGLGAYVCPEYDTTTSLTEAVLQVRSLSCGRGGGNGGGGTTSAAGAGTAGGTTVWAASAGGNSSAGAGANAAVAGVWTAGGGGGGGMASTHASTAGGTGLYPTYLCPAGQRNGPNGGASGTTTAKGQDGFLPFGNYVTSAGLFQNMALPNMWANFGGGGGGGNSVLTSTVNAGAGGNGAIGCGGGGGGSKENDTTYTSGAGGNGGPGMILIVAFG